MSFFDLPGDWITAFAQWMTALLQWLAVNAPQLLATFPWPTNGGAPGAGTPGTSFAATPELDSFMLFGTGLVGVGSYAVARIRARTRT